MGEPIPRRLARLYSKPPAIRSNLSGIVLVEHSKAKLVHEELLPPWQQPVQILLGSDRSSGLQVTDFWSLKMRKSIIKTFFPTKSLSKVGPVFHSYQRKVENDKITKLWRDYVSSPVLVPGSQTVRSTVRLPPLSVSPSSLHLKPKKSRSLPNYPRLPR